MQLPCSAPPNNEWLKILVSALIGMIVGLVAEPIKGAFQWRVNVLRMERAVLLDCMNVMVMQSCAKVGACTHEQLWQALTFPGFEYHWEKNREFYYDSIRLHVIRTQIQVLQATRQAVIEKRISPEDATLRLKETVEAIVQSDQERLWIHRKLKIFFTKIFC